MHLHLRSFYTPTETEFQRLWKEAIIVLDTSVLLNLYRYPVQAREDLLTVLEKNKDRLWLPFQVAIEFQRNRLSVVAEQVRRFKEVAEVVEAGRNSMLSGLQQLGVKKRHPLISTDEFENEINAAASKLRASLETASKTQPDVWEPDAIRDRLDRIFAGLVGNPYDDAKLQEIYREGESRFTTKAPPGYCDATGKKSKTESEDFTYGRALYKRRFGDLVLWKQMLDRVADPEIKSVIFVTDDMTEDWWWIEESGGKKTIGPRPELVREICSADTVELFYMYNSESFLKRANEHLSADVPPSSIEQIKDTKAKTDLPAKSFEARACSAVRSWILDVQQVEDTQVTSASMPLDFAVLDSHGRPRFGVQVKHGFLENVPTRTKTFLRNAHQYPTYAEGFLLVWAMPSRASARRAFNLVNSLREPAKCVVSVAVGYLSDKSANPSFVMLDSKAFGNTSWAD